MKIHVLALLLIGVASAHLTAQTSVPLDDQLDRLKERAKAPMEDENNPVIQTVSPGPAVPVVAPVASPTPIPPPPAQPIVPALPAGQVRSQAGGPANSSEIAEAKQEEGERVWVLDPRKNLQDQVVSSGYEPTSLYVQRALYIAGIKPEASPDDPPEWVQKIPVNIPVMHRTRYVRLDDKTLPRAKELLKRLIAARARLEADKKEVEDILLNWNSILGAGTPSEILTPDSSSLTTNQGGEVNEGKPEKGFEPGKEINFTIQ